MSEYSIFFQFSLLFLLAFFLILIFKLLKLSSIIAFILTGIILGPLLKIVNPTDPIFLFIREIGMILIAFEIGLTVKLSFLRKEYPIVVLVLISEIIIVFTIAFISGTLINLPNYEIIILALIAVNTSTFITFKLMEEKGLIKEFGGKEVKLTLAVASFEDLVAIISLTLLPLIFLRENITLGYVASLIINLIITSIALIGVGLFLIKKFIEKVYKLGEEIIFFFIVSTLLFITWISPLLGFSKLFNAFIIGLLLAETRIAEMFVEKYKWVRDFFAFAFFVSIGLILPSEINLNLLLSLIAIIFIIIFSKFFAFIFSFWSFITTLKNSIRIGFYMINVSEFGLIITSLAYSLGIISKELILTSALAMIISNIFSVILVNNEKSFLPLIEKLFPYKNYLEIFFGKFRKYLSYTNSKFLIIRKFFEEIIIIISLIFVFSSTSLFLIGYIVNIQILFKEIIIITLLSLFFIIMFELFLSLYKTLKKLLIEIIYYNYEQKSLKNLIYLIYFPFVLISILFISVQSYIFFVKIFNMVHLIFQFNIISILLISIILLFMYNIRKYLKKFIEEIQNIIKG